jgi:spore maturation protein SpmA
MLNSIFFFAILISTLLAAWNERMPELTDAVLRDSRTAVELALKLVGVMAFFLGLMKVAEDAGLLGRVARAVSPLMRRLFPSVPADHPAMSAMIMNIASNMLGLSNAATPFGVKAMEQLDRLNGEKGTATDAMVLFLAINTSGLALLPSNVIGLRAAAGSADAAGILGPTWFASGCATLCGIIAALGLSRLPRYRRSAPPPVKGGATTAAESGPDRAPEGAPLRRGRAVVAGLSVAAFAGLLVRHWMHATGARPLHELAHDVLSYWMLPAIVTGLLLFGWAHGVRVYDSLVEGAKEGFQVALRIIPFMVAILVAVGMFRASGGLGLLVAGLSPWTAPVGLPAEALPMAILRPLSGSGALAVMTDALGAYGPDSRIGYLVSTIQGSTETTFYVLAVYFGAVGIKRTRHALPACLLADLAGLCGAVLIINLLHG